MSTDLNEKRSPVAVACRPQPPLALCAAALATGVCCAVLLAACGGGHSSPTAQSGTQANDVVRRLVRCIRSHGMPNFPDPVAGSDGILRPPDSAPRVPATTQRACRAVADQLPANYTSTGPVSSGDFQKLLTFARCMRAHGVADWPDPNALGEFPLDRRLISGGKRLIVSGMQACARLNPNPSGGINAVQATP